MQVESESVSVRTPVRVAYDAQALVSGDGGTGKGVQLRNLINSRWVDFQGYAPPVASNELIAGVVQSGNRRYLIWQQTSLPRLMSVSKPDVFLAPYNTAPLWLPRETQLVLVLHDLIVMQKFKSPTVKKRFVDSYKRRLVAPSVTRASHVLTVSEFSRQRILECFPGARVTVIPCTIAASWFQPYASATSPQRENYILLVTAAPPHKNTARALRAYASYLKMAGSGPANLRIVGLSETGGPFRRMVNDLGLSERVVFEPFLSTTKLQELYRSATAILVPSLLEGFGIPVLEGMASGSPVITSRTSSLSEVGGEAVQYCDPLDEASISTAMLEVVGNGDLRQEMIRKGYIQAGKFHPDRIRPLIDAFWCQISSECAAS